MVIRSAGSCTWGLRLDLVNARAKDKLPIRPQYISSIITIRENEFRLLVTPVLIPEVPIAEHVSKNTSDIGRFWDTIMAMVAASIRPRLMVRMQADCLMDSSSSLLPNISTPYVWRILDWT